MIFPKLSTECRYYILAIGANDQHAMTHNYSVFQTLSHPGALLAMALFAMNNFWWKHQFGNFLTGKISDFAFCFFTPFFLVACFEFAHSSLEQQNRKKRWLMASILTFTLLLLVKTNSTISLFFDSISSNFLNNLSLHHNPNLLDKSDLWALTLVPLAYWQGIQHDQKNS